MLFQLLFPEPCTVTQPKLQPWVAQEDTRRSGQASSLEIELRRALMQTTRSWKYAGGCRKCPYKPFSCICKHKNYSYKKQNQHAFHGGIQTITLPFSLTRWYAAGRGRLLAKRGHRCPQTSDGGTRQSLAWLAGLRKVSRHDAHLLEEKRSEDTVDLPHPCDRAPQPQVSRRPTSELTYLTPKMAELPPPSTGRHGTLEKESAGEEGAV